MEYGELADVEMALLGNFGNAGIQSSSQLVVVGACSRPSEGSMTDGKGDTLCE